MNLNTHTPQTLSFYNLNAEQYVAETIDLDISKNRDFFLTHIPNAGHILDLGCGSGRDSRFFIDNGYLVTAVDGSRELAKLASGFIGETVEVKTFVNGQLNCPPDIYSVVSIRVRYHKVFKLMGIYS